MSWLARFRDRAIKIARNDDDHVDDEDRPWPKVDDQEPNFLSMLDANRNNQQVTLEYPNELLTPRTNPEREPGLDTHTIIPVTVGARDGRGDWMHSSVNAYCLTHGEWHGMASPKHMQNIRDIGPSPLPALPEDPRIAEHRKVLEQQERDLRDLLPQVQQTSWTPPADDEGAKWHPHIQRAIDNEQEFDMLYTKAKESQARRYVVIPTQLGPSPNGKSVYMRGYDPTGGMFKTFLTGRINQINPKFRPRSIEIGQDLEPLTYPDTQKAPSSGFVSENPSELSFYNINEDRGPVQPTDEEYDELRRLDIDPDTHDKATIRRLRNKGITHLQIKSAAEEHGLPYEDYESALVDTGYNHEMAVEEAKKYRQHDTHIIAKNKEIRSKYPNLNADNRLSDQDYKDTLEVLFKHHLTLKNLASSELESPYEDTPGRERAHEWILSELAKLDPSLKPHVTRNTYSNKSNILPEEGYYALLSDLRAHHNLGIAEVGLPDASGAEPTSDSSHRRYIVERRKLDALTRVANSKFYPQEYIPQLYEED